mmetsp:Transcript_16198/g.30207  ORF Transcript_16198/g.30207 Transcript_16198/m.30207 type:complete len:205 (-) Transcript_16198:800-1414(-)
MRNCTLRKKVSKPCAARRPNSDSDRPRTSASKQLTLGGSWQWSPTSTSWSAPRSTTGTSDESSVACAASSMRMAPKFRDCKKLLPEATVVQQITSAFLRMFCFSWKSSLGPSNLLGTERDTSSSPSSSLASSPASATIACESSWPDLKMFSRSTGASWGVTFSGRPIRTTLKPRLWAASARLSTAMLLSEVARSGRTCISAAHI